MSERVGKVSKYLTKSLKKTKTVTVLMGALFTMPLIALKSHSFDVKLRIVIL